MIWENYQLDTTTLKTTETMTLWRTEKGTVEIGKNTLAIPIKLNDQRKGYIFHGHGKLLLDTIVETQEGAVGKPVESELNELFLMLGETEEIQQHLSTATKEDLTKIGYESEKGFIEKAENLFDHFFGNMRMHNQQCCGNNYGVIFAFPNEAGKLDTLIANGSKLVYKAMNQVFVSNDGKVVLKTPTEVIVSGDNRKSLVIKKCIFHRNH
jgi:hypothetical protein